MHPTHRCLILVTLLVGAAASADAQTLERRRELTLSRDMQIQDLPAPRAVTLTGVQVPAAPLSVSSIRLHLRLVNRGSSPWAIVVETAGGAEVERVEAARFVDGGYWTSEVPGGSAGVRLTTGQSGAQIEIDKIAAPITEDKPQAIIGADDSRDITHPDVPTLAKQRATAVARLKFMTTAGGAVCTGFLVGPDLLLTNQHCVSNNAEASSARVEFGFDSAASVPVTFRVIAIEAVDARLDYSLLRLDSNASTKFGRLFVGPAVASQMNLFVLQHPQGRPKKAAFPPNCAVGSTLVAGVDDALNDFGHLCDTLGGSSGSPVVEAIDGSLVGLHHWRWPDGAKVPENQAVHIAFIVKDLTDRASKEKNPEKQKQLKAVISEVTRPRP